MYDEGLGVPKNYEMAFKYYQLASRKGDMTGQYHEGTRGTPSVSTYTTAMLHLNGLGTPKDYDKARVLFELASAQGDIDSHAQLGNPLTHVP